MLDDVKLLFSVKKEISYTQKKIKYLIDHHWSQKIEPQERVSYVISYQLYTENQVYTLCYYNTVVVFIVLTIYNMFISIEKKTGKHLYRVINKQASFESIICFH